MATKAAKAKASQIFSSKPNGREKIYLDSIHWGINKPYAYVSDCKKSGIKILKNRISPGGVFYYITKTDCEKLIDYLKE